MQFTIHVNNSPMEVHEGETLLAALRRNGIKIPTLCYMSGFTPSGACRLCVVEVEGKRDLVTSCSYPVVEGMIVKTNSARVIKARKSIVEMLLSNHPDDCLYCERNGNCELQWLAEEMNIKERKYFSQKKSEQRDHSSTTVYRDPAKCILCNRCVRVCEEVQLVTAIEFISRGNKTKVNSAFNKGLNVSSCINCGQCIIVCPTGALVDISHVEKVQIAIENPKKYPVALLSPAFVASAAEHLGLKAADNPAGLIVAALKKIGFRDIFDMGWSSDINVTLEAGVLANNLKKNQNLPLLSSCCPAWIKYAEEFVPEMIPDFSSVKSPQQIMGRLLKNGKIKHGAQEGQSVYNVSLTTCVANKYEAAREENLQKSVSEIDAVITVRKFLKLIRSYGIDIRRLEPDSVFPATADYTAAGHMMAYSGGKAEAIAYKLNNLLNGENAPAIKFSAPKNPGSKKEVKVKIGKQEIGFAWVSGILEAQEYFDALKAENRKDIHYIEVMACSGGCAGGGGQPIHWNTEKSKYRKKLSQELEKTVSIKNIGTSSHIMEYLQQNLENEEGKLSLYTRFRQRDVLK